MPAYLIHLNNTSEHGYPAWDIGAVGKCHHDRELFAQQIGINLIKGFRYRWDDEPHDVLSARLDGLLGGLKKDDLVFVHWPFSSFQSQNWCQMLIDRIHQFGASLIFIIDDIASWRDLPALPATLTAAELASYRQTMPYTLEIHFLSQADGLIVHSENMATRLQQQAQLTKTPLTPNIAIYGPSGYACEYFQPRRELGQGLDYAGAFLKAQFLSQLPADFKINAYGDDSDQLKLRDHANVTLYPHADPEAIAQELKGSFGLVWDSTSYPQVTGRLGEYEQYNTPAKFPMYLAADEPVVIWSKSPLAAFVEKNGLGLTIDTLDQLPGKIAALNNQQYTEMLNNVQHISGLIRNGYYLKKAYLDVIGMIKDHAYQPQ
ncbi:glycosyltransferase [Lapidilactobacillus wuchangensis]|uniref:glycosyltransferase n=1 Tax=Lapidilactobacillus wuchangensis TaxID=2486001 RepID=UPI000F788B15|nr:glycosyltransferase [Lapidilactobacillus wuchangensis]